MFYSPRSAVNLAFTAFVLAVSFLGCTKSNDASLWQSYLDSLSTNQAAKTETASDVKVAPTVLLNSSVHEKMGPGSTCGNGVIDDVNEYCDKREMRHTYCSDIGGISGVLECDKDCKLDISDCITPATDLLLGGQAETCKCNCANDRCSGGCTPQGTVDPKTGNSICEYKCNNDCTCTCEGKIEVHLQQCDFNCLCQVDSNNLPRCDCTMNECELLAVLSPNITRFITPPIQVVQP